MSATHAAANAAVTLSRRSRREFNLELALSDCECAAIEAQAILARCLCLADHEHITRACGVLARSVARAHTVRAHTKGA